MELLAKVGLLLFAIVGVALFAYQNQLILDTHKTQVAAVVSSDILATASQPATASFEETGTGMLDSSGVPYLLYNDGTAVATKRLIFASSYGCSVYTSDLPCAVPPSEGAPFQEGATIHVRGTVQSSTVMVSDFNTVSVPAK